MAHQAIYRKWRPMTFDDIVGQQHITRTLKNQILSDSVGHAYLFCGTRGTGKTTCAKVLSRAVNCLRPKGGNPCNECEVCRGIADGSITDVTEMDAASNNGVEDIRQIKDDLSYIASNAKYTVYIIDEVHMLSNSAFNALLKTLEEPPENVIFILATTEAHKVPQTILSRCQRFDFKRIGVEDIIVRMKEIAHADGYSLTDGAYRMLAQLADGSMRDGLSIMERVIAACGNDVTEDDIVDTLGISTQESVFALTDAILRGDSGAVIDVIDRVMSEGRDLSQLAVSVLAHLRALMICKVSDRPERLLECSAETLVRYKEQSGRVTFEKINHASAVISKAIGEARTARRAQLIYELAYIKLAQPRMDRSDESVMDRLAEVERKVSSGVQTPPTYSMPIQSGSNALEERVSAIEKALEAGARLKSAEEPKKEEKPPKKVSARLYNPIPKDKLVYDYPTAILARNWSSTVNIMLDKGSPYVVPLKNCTITFDADGIIIIVPDERNAFTERIAIGHIDKLRALFKEITHSEYTLKVAKRSELDEECIINPFELPKNDVVVDAPEPTPDASAQGESPADDEVDKLTAFIEKFEDIVSDGDRADTPFKANADAGEQESFDSVEEDDREEFLDDDEIKFEQEQE